MKNKAFILFWISTFVCVYGIDTSIEIIHNRVRQIYNTDFKEFNYNEGDDVIVTFSTTGLNNTKDQFMKLTLVKGSQSTILGETKNGLISFQDKLTKHHNDRILACNITTRQNESKQLKVHLVKNPDKAQSIKESGSKYEARRLSDLFKIILIALGAFIVTSIIVMIIISIYNGCIRKTDSNTPRYPVYEEIIPMQKANGIAEEEMETKVDISNDKHEAPSNEYVDTPARENDEDTKTRS